MHRILLLIPLLCCGSILSSQQLTAPGNAWVYGELDWGEQEYVEHETRIDRDTMLNGTTYQTLIRTSNIPNPSWSLLPEMLREDDQQRVYILDETGNEGILYDFSLDLHDTTTLWNGLTATVTRIDSVEVAHHNKRKIMDVQITGTIQGHIPCGYSTRWIEGIGGKEFLLHYPCRTDTFGALACFFHLDNVYYPAGSSWCKSFVISTPTVTSIPFRFFPNPFSTVLNVETENPLITEAVLYNVQGQVVFHLHLAETRTLQMETELLQSGIYFIQLSAGREVVGRARLIKI